MTLKHSTKGNKDSGGGRAEGSSIDNGEKRWLNRNVAGISLTSLFSDMSHEMATSILPFFIVAIGGTAAIVGLVEGASDAASSGVKSYSGHFSDKIGKRTPIMYVGYLLTAVLMPAIGLATAWVEVLALRIGAWMGRGARGPPRDALLIESVPGKFVGRAFGLQRALDTVGAVAGVGIALVLIQYLAYSQIFFVAFIPGVASILVVLVLVKDVKRKVAAAKPSSFRASLGGLPSNFRLFLVPVALFGVANFSNVLFTLRAQEVLQLQIGLKMADFYAILLYLILNVVYALTSYTSGFISDKISKRNILALGYAFFAFACFASIFEAANFPILIIIFVLAGVSVGIVDPLEGSFASEMLAGSQLGSGYGVLQTVNGVGDFVSSTMIGVLWTVLSPALGFAVVSGIATLATIMLLSLAGKSKKKEKKQH